MPADAFIFYTHSIPGFSVIFLQAAAANTGHIGRALSYKKSSIRKDTEHTTPYLLFEYEINLCMGKTRTGSNLKRSSHTHHTLEDKNIHKTTAIHIINFCLNILAVGAQIC
jgi:hypothetical protein